MTNFSHLRHKKHLSPLMVKAKCVNNSNLLIIWYIRTCPSMKSLLDEHFEISIQSSLFDKQRNKF